MSIRSEQGNLLKLQPFYAALCAAALIFSPYAYAETDDYDDLPDLAGEENDDFDDYDDFPELVPILGPEPEEEIVPDEPEPVEIKEITEEIEEVVEKQKTDLVEEPKERLPPKSARPVSRDIRFRMSGNPGLTPLADDKSHLGLFGLQFDTVLNDMFYVGIGGFGPLAGDHGGFFGAGLQGMVRYPVYGPVSVETGAMLGAGGGGSAKVGSGFFFRPRAGLHIDAGRFFDAAAPLSGIGLGFSFLSFPDGEVQSMNFDISLEGAFATLMAAELGSSWTGLGGMDERAYGVGLQSVRTTFHSYLTLAEGELQEDMRTLVGIEYREWFTNRIYGVIEPRALVMGGRAGYAELTMGAGYSLPLDAAERFNLFLSGGFGGAGGGGVDTGGGLFLRGAFGLDVTLPGSVFLALDAGIQEAPLGGVTAFSGGLRLGFANETIRPGNLALRPLYEEDGLLELGWRLRAGNLMLTNVASEGEDALSPQMLKMGIDYIFNSYVYLSAQAASTYAGLPDRGSFSIAALAVGGISPEWNKLRLTGEARVGAGGGGGIAVGDGIIIQPMGGILFELPYSLNLELLGGFMMAPTGDIASPALEVGLAYTFAIPRVASF